jgi:hypothetical protein
MGKLNIQNCIHVTRNIDKAWQQHPWNELVGTFKSIDNTLYFFDSFSREWEEFDYSFNILSKKEIKEVKRKLEI